MYNKPIKQDVSAVLSRHSEIVGKYNNHPEILAYNRFYAMPFSEQQSLRTEWNEYYDKCLESTEFSLYTSARDALKNSNFKELKAIGAFAREQLVGGFDEIPKPSAYDPLLLDRSSIVRQFISSQSVIKNLTNIVGIESLL